MTRRRQAVLFQLIPAALLMLLGAACSSTTKTARLEVAEPPVTAAEMTTLSEDEAWESSTRALVEDLLADSRQLADEGRTREALGRIDDALCEALEPPQGHAISPSYLDWVAQVIGEADAMEQDLLLLTAPLPEDELVDLPPMDISPDMEVAEIDEPTSLLPNSDFPLELNPTVDRWLDVIVREGDYRKQIERGLSRCGAYLPMIRGKLAAAGLPEDLAYLPLIESSFSNTAYSRARARGMWQFMSSTGRQYGLAVGSLVDERCDPELSTDAAIAFLGDLYGTFGDWNLALAAYNSGPGNVRRAIRRSGSTDFWKLQRYLPRETRNYVPAYMASVIVAKQPERFGFPTPVETTRKFDSITVSDALDMEFLATRLDLETETLRELNPAIRRDLTPAAGRTTLRLPEGYGSAAEEVLATTPKSEWAPRMMHTVRKGDTLSGISSTYGSSVSAIRQANGIRGNLIHPGQNLVVPRFGTPVRQSGPSKPSRQRVASGGNYEVQRNDTLWDIARSFGTSVDSLCSANGLTPRSTIRPGQRLEIPSGGSPSATTAPATTHQAATTYKVRRGDTLYDIARKFGISVSALRRANGLTSSRIYPGEVLRIPGAQARG